MVDWHDRLSPAGWKVYTLWSPPERGTGGGWYLDDDETGFPFLERVRELGPRIVCAHKGIAGPVASLAPASASPRDVGPAASAFPDVTFVVYHSGYEPDASEEGAHADGPDRGVSRLVTSLARAGVEPGANVYAELGSTWYLLVSFFRPRETAHVPGLLGPGGETPSHPAGTKFSLSRAPAFSSARFRCLDPEWSASGFSYPAPHRHRSESSARRSRSSPASTSPACNRTLAGWRETGSVHCLAQTDHRRGRPALTTVRFTAVWLLCLSLDAASGAEVSQGGTTEHESSPTAPSVPFKSGVGGVHDHPVSDVHAIRKMIG